MGDTSLKYQNLPAFEKHLQQAAKVHLSRVFLVVSACPYERKKIVEKIVAAIRTGQRDFHWHAKEVSQGSLEEEIAGLNTVSLLSGRQGIYLDGIDKLKKSGLTTLVEYVAHPSPFAYLLLGASSSKNLGDLYTKGKRELIVCDLSEEKPWDRKDRLKRSLVDEATKAGKRFHGDAVDYLLENIGLSVPGLEQELIKLITYVGERREIALQDVQMLCGAQKSTTVWQLAEAIVWKESLPHSEESVDLAMLLSLFSPLRLQLQQGLTLAILVERGAAQEQIAHFLPTVKPAALDKRLPIVKRRQSSFFKRALGVLFDIELLTKNSSFEPILIFDLLLTKIALLSNSSIKR
jgi:DNA polymerase III subunit delta